MAGKWMQISPGEFVRRTSDGEFERRRVQNLGESVDAKRRMREAVSGNIAKHTEVKDADLRFVGSMPGIVAEQMRRECCGDREKESAFIRDHYDEIGGIPKNSANLPKKKSYSYSKQRRRK